MDNFAHALAGWALGEAGLKRKTGLATATLIIAANLPDVDVLGLVFGENLAFRRGITHGPLAMVIMVPALSGAVLAFDRWQTRRGTRPADRLPVSFGWLLLLSLAGVVSHPALDFLNVYGIRCLMPFSEQWFYGDTLFIIDVWLWSALAIGIFLSRRWHKRSPAAISMIMAGIYVGAMGAGSVAAEQAAAHEVERMGLGTPRQVVANTPPFDPFSRGIIYDLGDRYGFGEARLFAPRGVTLNAPFATNLDDPAVVAAIAADNKQLDDFLYWSRLPFAEVTTSSAGRRVTFSDARFVGRAASGPFTVVVEVPAEK